MIKDDFKELSAKLSQELNNIKQIKEENSVFNLFEELRIEKKELIFCLFITALLNNKTEYSDHISYLQSFFNDVLNEPELFKEAKDWKAKVEQPFKPDLKKDNGEPHSRRIDILIYSEIENIRIPIEVKIYSGDRDGQIKDNVAYLSDKSLLNKKAFYLTLFGGEPSEKSRQDANIEQIINISFKNHIFNWLEKRKPSDNIELESSIKMFMNVIREICDFEDLNLYIDFFKIFGADKELEVIHHSRKALEALSQSILRNIFSIVERLCRERFQQPELNDEEAIKEWQKYDQAQLDNIYKVKDWPGYSIVLTRNYILDKKQIHIVARLILNIEKDYMCVELTTESQGWKWVDDGKRFKSIVSNSNQKLINEEEIDIEECFTGHVIVKSRGIKDANGNIPKLYNLDMNGLELRDIEKAKEYANICAIKLIDLIEKSLEFIKKDIFVK